MKKFKLLFCLFAIALSNSCLKDLNNLKPVNSSAQNTVRISEVVTWLAQLPQAADLHLQWNNATQIVLNNHNVIQLPIAKDASLFFTKTNGKLNAFAYKWLNKDPGARVFTGNVIAFSFQDNSIKCLVYDKGKLVQSNVKNLYDLPLSSPGTGNGGSEPSSGSTSQQNFRPLDIVGGNFLGALLCWITGGTWTGFQTNYCDYSTSIWVTLRSLFPDWSGGGGSGSGTSDPSVTTTTISGDGSIASAIISSGAAVTVSNATAPADGSGGMVYVTVNPPPGCDPGIGGATFNPDGSVYDPCGTTSSGPSAAWVPINYDALDTYTGDEPDEPDDDANSYTGPTEHIPSQITLNNGQIVSIEFGTTASDNKYADNPVSVKLVNLLIAALNTASQNVTIYKIHIEATTNGKHVNNPPLHVSNHYSGLAIDLSRINGIPLAVQGPSDMVKQLQLALDQSPDIRENLDRILNTDLVSRIIQPMGQITFIFRQIPKL